MESSGSGGNEKAKKGVTSGSLSVNASTFNPSINAKEFIPSSNFYTGNSSASNQQPSQQLYSLINPTAIPEFVPGGGGSTSLVSGVQQLSVQPQLSQPPSTSDSHQQPQSPLLYSETPTLNPPTHLDSHGYPQPPVANHFLLELGPVIPLQHHLYTPVSSSLAGRKPNERNIRSYSVNEDLRKSLLDRLEVIRRQAPPHSSHVDDDSVPAEIHSYHSLVRMDTEPNFSSYLGHGAISYKAKSSVDGRLYLLLRVQGIVLTSAESLSAIDKWTKARHSNVVQIKEAFSTKSFDDDSLILVYHFHPNSITVLDKYFQSPAVHPSGFGVSSSSSGGMSRPGSSTAPHSGIFMRGGQFGEQDTSAKIDQKMIWAFLCQISGALKVIHAHQLAYRNMGLNSIVVTGRMRFRLACCGALNVVRYDPTANVQQLMNEDILSLGQCTLQLAIQSLTIPDIHMAMDYIGRTFAPDLYHVIGFLLTPHKTIDEVIGVLSTRFGEQLDMLQRSADFLENELMRELENSRLARLLIKLGFVNERPEFGYDAQWSETGDRYLIKLFRDHVFHQVDASGKPVLDLEHVIQNLNMLDSGSDERIMLTSRDERSCIIVTYRDLKQCIQSAFEELSLSRS